MKDAIVRIEGIEIENFKLKGFNSLKDRLKSKFEISKSFSCILNSFMLKFYCRQQSCIFSSSYVYNSQPVVDIFYSWYLNMLI